LKWNLETFLSISSQDTVRYNKTFMTLNSMSSLNGYLYGNLNPIQGLVLPTKSRIRWYILSIGVSSVRSVQWDGHELEDSQNSLTQTISISTPGYAIGDLVTDKVTGTWILSSTSETEMEAGMMGTYEISSSVTPSLSNSSNKASSSLSNGAIVGIFLTIFLCCCIFPYLVYRSLFPQKEIDNCLADCSTHSSDPLTPMGVSPAAGGGGSIFQRGKGFIPESLAKFKSSSSSQKRFIISSSDGGSVDNSGKRFDDDDEEDYVGNTKLTLSNVNDREHYQNEKAKGNQQREWSIYQSNPLHEGSDAKFSSRDESRTSGAQFTRLTDRNGVPNLSDNPAFSIDSSEDRL
jgi:hypothetical protein